MSSGGPVRKWFPTEKDLASRGTFGDTWRSFWAVLTGEVYATGIWWAEARDGTRQPTKYRTAPPTMENHLAAYVKSTKAENPCMRAMVLKSLTVPGLLLGDGSGPWACAIWNDPQGL